MADLEQRSEVDAAGEWLVGRERRQLVSINSCCRCPQRCKKRQIRQIYLCYFFPAGANFWTMHAKNNVPAPVLLAPVSTDAVSTISISISAMGNF